jgi:hypothetical protein
MSIGRDRRVWRAKRKMNTEAQRTRSYTEERFKYGKNKGKNKKSMKFPLLIFEEGTGEVRAMRTYYQPPPAPSF